LYLYANLVAAHLLYVEAHYSTPLAPQKYGGNCV